MPNLNDIRKPVYSEMQEFEKHFRSTMQSRIPLMNVVTNYLRRRKGKQMRPLLVFLSASLTGKISPSTNNAASLIELLHTATLIHDDVVDEAYERRGFFSINALWKSKLAVLVGDYLLAKGLLLAVNEKEFELLSLVSDAVREMSEGELMQIQKSRKLNLSEEDYLEIIRKKTASLIAACTACGAHSSGTDPEIVAKMKLFGENLGMAFQIKDDLFDYQKKGLIGKPTGNDIKEKKLTLPLIHALENCSDRDRKYIRSTIRKHNHNSSKVQEVIEFTTRNNGLIYSEEKMYNYRDNALEILKDFPDNEALRSLVQLVNYVVERDK